MKRRVVISGLGLVTSLGANVDIVWRRILEGESGIVLTTLFDTTNFPSKISGEVRDWSLADVGEDPEQWNRRARHTGFAVGAAKMAAADALLTESSVVPTRLGVYLGCGDAYQDFAQFVEMVSRALDGDQLNLSEYLKSGLKILDPIAEMEMEPHMPTSHVARIFDAQGPTCSCFTACAAGGQAIGEAAEIIRRGDADVMLAGGTHSLIHPFGFTGLSLLTALSKHNDEPTKASRPFDRDRDGFVLGEGAGILVLEELDHARRRGAPIYAELRGYGSTADAYRITDAHPEGRGATRCMEGALDDAELNPEEIDYINAHGTSTELNDRIETLAIKKVFGSAAYETPVSSTKSMIGHLLAAAGATELIMCVKAIQAGALPPTINYETPDRECDLDYVPNETREVACSNVLSNSFGFGGQNVSLVVSRLTCSA